MSRRIKVSLAGMQQYDNDVKNKWHTYLSFNDSDNYKVILEANQFRYRVTEGKNSQIQNVFDTMELALEYIRDNFFQLELTP